MVRHIQQVVRFGLCIERNQLGMGVCHGAKIEKTDVCREFLDAGIVVCGQRCECDSVAIQVAAFEFGEPFVGGVISVETVVTETGEDADFVASVNDDAMQVVVVSSKSHIVGSFDDIVDDFCFVGVVRGDKRLVYQVSTGEVGLDDNGSQAGVVFVSRNIKSRFAGLGWVVDIGTVSDCDDFL